MRFAPPLGAVDARQRDTEAVAAAWPHFAVRTVRSRLIAVTAYAVAMAYVESAAVLYLRTIYGGIDPAGPRHTLFSPLPDFVGIEIGREAATMVMLAAVGFLAGATPIARVGAFALAMGTWDAFYYVFLWLFAGWPGSPLAPDVLFLLPLPWWGPVLSPVLVAVLIAVAGAAAMAREAGDGVPPATRSDAFAIAVGAGLCLVAFMWDALSVLPAGGIEAAYYVRGGPFPWPVYALGVVIGAAGLVRTLIRTRA
jgi:hypothetical protein